jgi:pimeloyl-ACP methyl ester carboxylesterase
VSHTPVTEVRAERSLPASRFALSLVELPEGARVAVRGAGSAARPAIVLLHGISSGAGSWLHCALALGEDWRVLAWDAPGYGESTPLEAAAPLASDYAARLDRTLRALGIDTCLLVGHSLGALMAAAFAASATRAAKVERVLFVSPARGYGAPEQADTRRKVEDERLGALRTLGIAGLAERLPARLLSNQADAAAREQVRSNALRLDPAGYTQAVRLLCGDSLARYAPLAVPVEVACGEADAVTPPAACEAVARDFAAPFASIARAGHASPIEQPAALAALIARAAAQAFAQGRPS